MLQFSIFSHQGGWDEIIMVVAPIFLVWCLLALANKRAKQQHGTIDEELSP
ncbi:MAG: hypothetical protein P8J01_06465 [Acidimicrobiales bacterium]|jgi:hypothetical protein|nr:hypothetical protein [Acidimicrobiales bacterium]